MVLSDAEKAFDKVQHTFMIKNILIKLGREELPQLDKEFLKKKKKIATASTKKLDTFHLKIRSKRMSTLSNPRQHCIGSPNAVRQEKEIKSIQLERKK